MTRTRKFLTAAALTGMGMMVAVTGIAPFAGAQASGRQADMAASRISAAFALAAETAADPALMLAASRSGKGDGPASAGCGEQKWPEIATGCLIGAKGDPIRSVRYVTIGYQTGSDSAVLMRMPAPQIASR